MINEKIYQTIYDELDQYMYGGWDKLVAYFEYGKASYSFSFYVKLNGTYTKCYDLDGVSESDLTDSFAKLDKSISVDRSKEQEPWTNMTLVVNKDGKMHADFDYTDLSGGTFQFRKNWKKKYLI